MADKTDVDYEPGVLRVLQSKEETKHFYNKIARVYDLLAEHSEQPMREAGLQLLDARPGERLLELGFGTGHCLKTLAEAVGEEGRVFGVDLSETMVELAQQTLSEAGLAGRVELTCGDAAERLPLADASVDGIFMSFTLELFDTPEIPIVLAECRRVLKPGGRLVVVGVSKEGKQNFVVSAFEWTHRHFPNLMDCRPIFIARALEAAGFLIREKQIEHMWVPVEVALAVSPT